MPPAAIPPRSRPARSRRRRRPRLGSWERLGVGSGREQLESRLFLAADLGITIDSAQVWYMPASQVTSTVTVRNLGADTATAAVVSTALAGQFARSTWTAAYSAGGSGPAVGAGNLAGAVTLPAGGTATFTVVSTVGPSANGPLTSTASVSLAGDPDAANDTARETLQFAARPLLLADDSGVAATSLVRVVDPANPFAEAARFFAYEPGYRGGVQAVLADVDRDGRPEVVTASGRGRVGEIRVFALDGTELPQYRTRPFGPGWRGGVRVAVGDADADGRVDFAAAKASGDGEVRVFRGQDGVDPVSDLPFRTIHPFASTFLGGATVAFADLGRFTDGAAVDTARPDGRDELLVGSGPAVAAVVQVRDLSSARALVIDTIRPFGPAFVGGVNVAAARVNLDSIPDVLVASGRRGAGRVEVYDGVVGRAANPRLASFAAFPGRGADPTAVSAADTDGDGRADELFVAQAGQAVRRFSTAGLPLGGLAPVAGRVAAPAAASQPAIVKTASGLEYRDLVVGTGALPTPPSPTVAARVTVNYEGRLLDGTRFDGNAATEFALDAVIAGWREGLATMRVGGRRQLIIPPNLGYGPQGSPPKIPGDATLVFDVELLATR